MLIIKIILIIAVWVMIGCFVSLLISEESTTNEDRIVFAIFLWPIAFTLKILRFIFVFINVLISGFIKEIKALFE